MVVNKKNIKQSLFELGIQLFLGTRSGFTALCYRQLTCHYIVQA